jgi:hypothetical protein
MNINDIEKDEKLPECLLRAMFEKQKELHEKYVPIESAKGILTSLGPVDINTCHGQQIIKDFFWRITEELGEAANCLKNKPWKQTEILTDEEHFKEEVIDALHFFIEALILMGFDAESLYQYYFKKNKVNQFRQRSKY